MASDRFVSRGGDKLQAALEKFEVDPMGKTVLDVGSSTGGFVDCLLQNGASKVYAVDTAYGELAWKLRNDPRVIVMERTNILHLKELPTAHLQGEGKVTTSGHLGGGNQKVDLVTIDAGWTKLELVLPVVREFLKEEGKIIALLKPHYQADKKILKGGVVPKELVLNIKDQVLSVIGELGFKTTEEMESPILGGAGNMEFLLLISLA